MKNIEKIINSIPKNVKEELVQRGYEVYNKKSKDIEEEIVHMLGAVTSGIEVSILDPDKQEIAKSSFDHGYDLGYAKASIDLFNKLNQK